MYTFNTGHVPRILDWNRIDLINGNKVQSDSHYLIRNKANKESHIRNILTNQKLIPGQNKEDCLSRKLSKSLLGGRWTKRTLLFGTNFLPIYSLTIKTKPDKIWNVDSQQQVKFVFLLFIIIFIIFICLQKVNFQSILILAFFSFPRFSSHFFLLFPSFS